jgi:hypothetical protein
MSIVELLNGGASILLVALGLTIERIALQASSANFRLRRNVMRIIEHAAWISAATLLVIVAQMSHQTIPCLLTGLGFGMCLVLAVLDLTRKSEG